MTDHTAARIPEDRVAAILARAAELDRATRETMGTDVLRAAALEAGISPAAVDRALAEYAAGRESDSLAPPGEAESESGGRWRRWLDRLGRVVRPLALGGVALVAGVLIAEVGAGGTPLLVAGLVAWAVYAVRAVRRRRTAGRVGGYIAAMVAIAVGGMVGFGGAGGDLVELLLVTGLALTLGGALAIKLGSGSGAPARAVVPNGV